MNAGQPTVPGPVLSYTSTLRRTPLCGAATERLAPVSNNIVLEGVLTCSECEHIIGSHCPIAGDVEWVAKAARHDSDSRPNPDCTYASNKGKRASTHRTPGFRRQCASLRGRGLLRARVRLKNLP